MCVRLRCRLHSDDAEGIARKKSDVADSLKHVEAAFERNIGELSPEILKTPAWDLIESDSDLDEVRKDQEFEKLKAKYNQE